MKIQFSKYHGLGNDYLFIHTDRNPLIPESILPELARTMSRRRLGIGADGIVLLEKSTTADIRMRIFNSDGSEAENCGNALRCIARIVWEETGKTEIAIAHGPAISSAWVIVDRESFVGVKVEMISPKWNRKDIPVAGTGDASDIDLSVNGQALSATCLSVGNPHCVILVENVTEEMVLTLGPKIEHLPLFPNRINVGFAQINSRDKITLMVWERGAGFTTACGTGAAAAFAVARKKGLISSEAEIALPGGTLLFQEQSGNRIYMTGPASRVFSGSFFFRE